MAARAAMSAAPVIPGDPATSQIAAFHLWLSRGRSGIHPPMSDASTSPMVDRETSRPMSATETVPA